MTDELTTMLAKDSTLRIISRTSVMQYKHARQPLKDIARALGADGIVEGSVARNGDHVHLNLQLIQAATDSHLWAESYDRDANDVALSDEAARAIASRLHSAALTASPPRPIDPAAHDAYLHGRYLWLSSRDAESGPYFKKATEIQPDYAAAWAGLADYYGKAVVADELDPRIAIPLQEQASARSPSTGILRKRMGPWLVPISSPDGTRRMRTAKSFGRSVLIPTTAISTRFEPMSCLLRIDGRRPWSW